MSKRPPRKYHQSHLAVVQINCGERVNKYIGSDYIIITIIIFIITTAKTIIVNIIACASYSILNLAQGFPIIILEPLSTV